MYLKFYFINLLFLFAIIKTVVESSPKEKILIRKIGNELKNINNIGLTDVKEEKLENFEIFLEHLSYIIGQSIAKTFIFEGEILPYLVNNYIDNCKIIFDKFRLDHVMKTIRDPEIAINKYKLGNPKEIDIEMGMESRIVDETFEELVERIIKEISLIHKYEIMSNAEIKELIQTKYLNIVKNIAIEQMKRKEINQKGKAKINDNKQKQIIHQKLNYLKIKEDPKFSYSELQGISSVLNNNNKNSKAIYNNKSPHTLISTNKDNKLKINEGNTITYKEAIDNIIPNHFNNPKKLNEKKFKMPSSSKNLENESFSDYFNANEDFEKIEKNEAEMKHKDELKDKRDDEDWIHVDEKNTEEPWIPLEDLTKDNKEMEDEFLKI